MVLLSFGMIYILPGGQKILAKSANGGGLLSESVSNRIIEDKDSHIIVIDDLGHNVKIPKPVETILILDGKSAHVIRALHAEEMIIGYGTSMTLDKEIFPVITGKPSVGNLHNLDYEKIMQLAPDLIIASYLLAGQIEQYLSPVFPVVRLVFDDNDDVTILGRILDKEKEAAEYANWIDGYIKKIESRVEKLRRDEIPDVFIFYGGASGKSPPPPYGTYGKDNTLGNRSVERAGGRSISKDLPGEWVDVDPEWLVTRNPTIVVREYYFSGKENNPLMGYHSKIENGISKMMKEMVSTPVFERFESEKEKNFHIIDGYLIQEYWFLGVCYLASWFHPELFKDMDPLRMHQEFMTRFLRADFNVYQKGVFTYSFR